MSRSIRTSAVIVALIGISTLLYSAFVPLSEKYLMRQLQQNPISLHVVHVQQKKVTSCGEAVITVAYNYVYPQNPIQELDVIAYATPLGYYTDSHIPFTSPADMVKIARHYAKDVSGGRVITQEQGLILLIQKLQNNEPIIIDVLTQLNDPSSGAHFILVTGMSLDSDHENAILIYYNNPLTARNESAPWVGADGIWNSWQTNGDPGGSGWWMVIHAQE